jgi:hypothetical protein
MRRGEPVDEEAEGFLETLFRSVGGGHADEKALRAARPREREREDAGQKGPQRAAQRGRSRAQPPLEIRIGGEGVPPTGADARSRARRAVAREGNRLVEAVEARAPSRESGGCLRRAAGGALASGVIGIAARARAGRRNGAAALAAGEDGGRAQGAHKGPAVADIVMERDHKLVMRGIHTRESPCDEWCALKVEARARHLLLQRRQCLRAARRRHVGEVVYGEGQGRVQADH